MTKVYVIAAAETGPCKIGFSIDPYKRLSELQPGHPLRLSVMAHIEPNGYTAPELERLAHQRFSDRRLQGEWFDAPVKVITEFLHNAGPTPLCDPLEAYKAAERSKVLVRVQRHRANKAKPRP